MNQYFNGKIKEAQKSGDSWRMEEDKAEDMEEALTWSF